MFSKPMSYQELQKKYNDLQEKYNLNNTLIHAYNTGRINEYIFKSLINIVI